MAPIKEGVINKMKTKLFTVIFAFFIALALILSACVIDPPNPRSIPVLEVTLDRANIALNLWTSEDYDQTTALLSVTVLPAEANQTIIWGSSNSNAATVVDGLVTAVGPGTAIITAIARDGGFMASCAVLVVDQEPGTVEAVSIPSNINLYLGGTNTIILRPEFTPVFVADDTVEWESSNEAVATVVNGVVTAAGVGTAVITITTEDGGFTDTCFIMVTPLLAQFDSIISFITAGGVYYRPGFNFGTDPGLRGDDAANTSTWSGTGTNNPDFVINYTFNNTRFGTAGPGNLVPRFEHPKDTDNFIPAGDIESGLFRSHTQFNYASLAHYAFTGFRQAHPWGIHSLPSGTRTTRAGHTWSVGFTAYAANTNTVQFSGLGVDLESDVYIDTVLIYAGGNVTSTSPFNSSDPDAQCPGITLEYMPGTASGAQAAFDALYKANLVFPTINWNNPSAENNWPAPGSTGSPWISGGRIVPNGSAWVFVFHFEQPVLARFLRVNFEQALAAPPATGFLGRAFVNSFEVYNTRSAP
jgi:hypothetical protein